MEDLSKLARPYAVAAFKQACDEEGLVEWSAMLDMLETVMRDPTMTGLVSNPNVRRDELASLVVDVSGEHLSQTGRNFVRVLAEYGRLATLPEIARQYREQRSNLERRTDVEIVSAFELTEAERNDIIVAMTRRLGNKVDVKVSVDDSLLGGIVIRAGDTVIDASMRGQLSELARTLG